MTSPSPFAPAFAAGQCWTYRAPRGFETSRIHIGAIFEFANGDRLIAACVTDAPQRLADGRTARGTIPLLPLSEAALRQTVVALAGEADLPESFLAAFEAWNDDDRGGTFFTVPFEGHLDKMIARQMAEISGAAAE